jgi:hypothetical protein
MSKEVHDVLVARWEGFRVLAKKLPNHHILAVELFRTLNDETIAVFTTVRNGEPVRSVVTGDSHGRVKSNHCEPHALDASKAFTALDARASVAGGTADPASIALEEPPVKEPGRPGIVAIGGGLLGAAFDVGELVDTSAP